MKYQPQVGAVRLTVVPSVSLGKVIVDSDVITGPDRPLHQQLSETAVRHQHRRHVRFRTGRLPSSMIPMVCSCSMKYKSVHVYQYTQQTDEDKADIPYIEPRLYTSKI